MRFFNTISQQKEIFKPIETQKVKMYCCGITPYSNMHLGHMRTFFAYDLLHRILVDAGYEVEWARNVTDVDDKIILKANAENKSCQEITARYVAEQNEYLKIFDLQQPPFEPKVTENIPQIIAIIERLIQKEFAYVSDSGVYFRVRKFSEYGKLSKNKIDDLKKGARIEIDETKEDALDFALWKFAKSGEIFWQSPWGNGRPGWHIECSAMIHTLFGESIDIHMGGRDLIFPHHEAEIAQSEACTGCALANYWLHCGMMTLYHEKMSKSTNHYVNIEEFLNKYPPEVLRLVFLSSSYSQPLDFTFELVDENLKKLSRMYRFVALIDGYAAGYAAKSDQDPVLKRLYSSSFPMSIGDNQLQGVIHTSQNDVVGPECGRQIFANLAHLKNKMRELLSEDMNSTMALAEFFEFMSAVNADILKLEKRDQQLSEEDKKLLQTHWSDFKIWMKNTLCLFTKTPQEFFENLRKFNCAQEISESEILKKIEKRRLLRAQKEWKESDAMRDELLKHGIQIMDTPRGTKWFLS